MPLEASAHNEHRREAGKARSLVVAEGERVAQAVTLFPHSPCSLRRRGKERETFRLRATTTAYFDGNPEYIVTAVSEVECERTSASWTSTRSSGGEREEVLTPTQLMTVRKVSA